MLGDHAVEILHQVVVEASRPSRRYGVEWTNRYQPMSWLRFDGDIALTHARFRGDNSGQAAFNLTNSHSDQITYAYGSLLKSDPLFAQCLVHAAPAAVCATGVMDRVLHPVEPLAVRVTLAGRF
ncbi:hypothetical protein ASC80_01965 [Afipia sp. Root123D2]|nr:hypothetical protein ASC80_01965 [Afipia sp. Root123D2]